MLRYNSVVECYKYSIDLVEPIDKICKLSFNIAKISRENFTVQNLFSKDYLDEIGFTFESVLEVPNVADPNAFNEENEINKLVALIGSISDYYNNKVIGLNELQQTKILFIHKETKILYALNKSKQNLNGQEIGEAEKRKNLANSFSMLIKEKNFMQDIIKAIDDEVIRNCLLESITFEHSEFYAQYIDIEKPKKLEVPYLKLEFLKEECTIIEPFDSSNLWINKKKLNEILNIQIGDDENISSVKLKNEDEEFLLGILYNDFIFPLSINKLNEFIKDEFKHKYHWIQIKEVFKINDTVKQYFSDPLILDFKSNFKNKKFTRMLSHLNQNLYLDDKYLTGFESFKKFFIDILKIDEVKYLEKYNFFISNSDASASLGIYSLDKIGDGSAFNLLHWFRKIGDEHQQFRDHFNPKLVKKNIKNFKALSPEIAFYFITKFFEDFLQKIFEDLEMDFISNFHLYNDDISLGEFDFLIQNGSKFYFIEAKTTISKENIKKYIKKCDAVLKAFNGFDIEIEFLIVGSYSNRDCEELRYKSHKGNRRYNVPNKELGTVPHLFSLQISNEKNLTCIAEPDYHLLKNLIKKHV